MHLISAAFVVASCSYREEGKATHLINAGKYASTICVTLSSLLSDQSQGEDSAYAFDLLLSSVEQWFRFDSGRVCNLIPSLVLGRRLHSALTLFHAGDMVVLVCRHGVAVWSVDRLRDCQHHLQLALGYLARLVSQLVSFASMLLRICLYLQFNGFACVLPSISLHC